MGKIVYFGKRKDIQFLNKTSFFLVAERVCSKKNKTISRIAYVLVSDDALLEINRTHLNHDYYTDIITFDLSDKPKRIEAEIYISTDRVIENAQPKKTQEEFLRVMFHGILHLCGYADKSKKEQKEMRFKEDQCITLYREFTGN
jgi:probable rRNA maturation factor